MARVPGNAALGPYDSSRRFAEPPDPLYEPFELDRHRIIHCTAFRRLGEKTQVFSPIKHDHFRNRLTHTLEVAQIARCLARNCGGNPDLSEAISLAHDLGHPPFSHAGETALNDLMAGRGGFNHNAHSIRVVEYLEHPYPAFRGLNLTAATLNGLRAHETRYDKPASQEPSVASVEAHVASIADRIAYDLHDLEDAIGAELITEGRLSQIAIWREAMEQATSGGKYHNVNAVRRPVLDTILNRLLTSVIQSESEARTAGGSSLRLSSSCETALGELEALLIDRVYHHPEVARADAESRQIIHDLFSAYMRNPELMPSRFAERIAEQGPHRVVCDYIAGMTDSYCRGQHGKLCSRLTL